MSEKDEDLARKSAHILGDASASARALAKLDALRAKGKRAEIVSHGSSWYVMELPPEERRSGDGETGERNGG